MVNFKNSFLALVVIFLYISLYSDNVNNKCIIYLNSESGKKNIINAEVAGSSSEREKGLMYRESLSENDGMLFVFEKEQNLSFWMKNTLIPLDIAYINKNGIINEIYHMKPLDVSVTYNSVKPAMFALEVNLGWYGRHKIKPGSKIEFNGCLSKPDSLIKR